GDQHFDLAFDVIADCLRHSLFEAREIEKERAVIIEELAMVEDSPADLAGVLIDEAMWPEQALGRDVAGSRESVEGITRDVMLDYLARQYSPRNVVVSVAGNVSHERVVEAARRHMGQWDSRPIGRWFAARERSNGQPV